MIQKKFRLKIGEFPQKAKTEAVTPHFFLKKQKNNLPQNRFGVLVPAKAEKRASKRNAIKRIIMNEILKNAPKKGGSDYLFILHKDTPHAPAREFKNNLRRSAAEAIRRIDP